MGRTTWVVVAVIGAIAAVAAADALRGGGEPRPASAPATTATERSEPSTEARPPAPGDGDGLGGVLYYTNERCELRAVLLPALEPVDAPGWDECRFVLSPDGTRASGAGSGWDPYSDPRIGRLFQAEDGTIHVASDLGPEGEPIDGSAPAWLPNGILTFFRDGALRDEGGAVLLGQGDLARAVRAHPDVPDAGRVGRVSVRETAWLAERDTRAATILEAPVGRGRDDVLALFDGRRLLAAIAGDGERLGDLRASPGGGFVAARAGADDLLLLDARGRLVPTPSVPDARAVAFSPDDRWAAVATGEAVLVFRLGEAQPQVRRLPLAAADLAWRGEARPAALVSTQAARAWLGDVGAAGRLFVTEPTCRLSALRVPTLEWEDEPARERAPCRFALGADGEPAPAGLALSPRRDRTAFCDRSAVFVVDASGAEIARYRDACAPSWNPDGRLTFVRDGELFAASPGEGARRLVSAAALRRMFGGEAALAGAAWLDGRRAWAAVRLGDGVALALLTSSDLVYSPQFRARRIHDLRVGRGGMVAAETDRGVVLFDAGGRRALTFPDGRAVAWAPDALVAAVATADELLFVAPVTRDVVAVPLVVRDLEWVAPR